MGFTSYITNGRVGESVKDTPPPAEKARVLARYMKQPEQDNYHFHSYIYGRNKPTMQLILPQRKYKFYIFILNSQDTRKTQSVVLFLYVYRVPCTIVLTQIVTLRLQYLRYQNLECYTDATTSFFESDDDLHCIEDLNMYVSLEQEEVQDADVGQTQDMPMEVRQVEVQDAPVGARFGQVKAPTSGKIRVCALCA